MSASAPPRTVTRALLASERLIYRITPQEARQLRCSSIIHISTMKYADERKKLNFGFGVRTRGSNWLCEPGGGLELQLCHLPWCRDMDAWGPNEWAWLIVLLMHQASDVLPPFKASEVSASDGRRPKDNRGPLMDNDYIIMIHYKIKPSDPVNFGHEVVDMMCGIIPSPRFSGDKASVFHDAKASKPYTSPYTSPGPGSRPVMTYAACPQDLVSDAALVFDTSWHWKRAAELLEAEVKDFTARPACTYLIGESDHAVLSGDGKWFPSPQAYIEHRLDSAVSSLPAEERRTISDMIISLARAEQAGTSDSPNMVCDSMLDYAARCSVELKKRTMPRALKAAFKKFGILIPEMEEAGVVHRCACCDALPSPNAKLLSCPCQAVRYCSKDCQKAHWKSSHKKECPTATKPTSKTSGTASAAGTSTARLGEGRSESDGHRSGPAATRRTTKRKPSEAAVAAASKDICAGKDNGRGPLPGSEAAEAYKECLRRMMTAAAMTSNPLTLHEIKKALEHYEGAEVAFFTQCPDAPDWANDKK